MKEKYPQIKRVYVRAEFPHISDHYRNYLLEDYEETYYPEKLFNAGKAVYVERNYTTIQSCRFCIFYYDENYIANHKSGTKIALDYAIMQNKEIIKFPIAK